MRHKNMHKNAQMHKICFKNAQKDATIFLDFIVMNAAKKDL